MSNTQIIVSKEALSLKEKIEAIVVTSKEQYSLLMGLVVQGRNLIKKRKAEDEPGIISAKEHLDFLKQERDRKVAEVQEIVDAAAERAEAWVAEERRLARVEQDRINEENRRKQQAKAEADRREAERIAKDKRDQAIIDIEYRLSRRQIGKREAAKLLKEAGAEEQSAKLAAELAAEEAKAAPAPQVRVKPDVPTVAGVRRTTNYKANFDIPAMLIADYRQALQCDDLTRANFLEQFIMVNNQKLGEFARATKNSKKVAELVPGSRAWEEDNV